MVYTGDRKREYQLAWIKARRDAWVTENGPCNWCGSNEDLEVDHIDRYIKDVPVTQVWSLSPHNPKRVKELEKCVKFFVSNVTN